MENETLLEWAEKNKMKEMTPEQKQKMDMAIAKAKAEIPIIFSRGRWAKKVDETK